MCDIISEEYRNILVKKIFFKYVKIEAFPFFVHLTITTFSFKISLVKKKHRNIRVDMFLQMHYCNTILTHTFKIYQEL